MPRRVSLPGADELFRTTGGPALRSAAPRSTAQPASQQVPEPAAAPVEERLRAVPPIPVSTPARQAAEPVEPVPVVRRTPRLRPRSGGDRRPTGRERHDEKITVYVSNEELIDLEHARIVLRGDHGLAVDRGRIVREAIDFVLADLEDNGAASILVRRLNGS